MAVFNSAVFYSGVYFTDSEAPVADAVKTGTGGIDPKELRRRIVKPTGLLHLPKKEGRKDVADRVADSRGMQVEIAAKLAREFSEEPIAVATRQPVAEMSLDEIDAERGVLLRNKLRTEDDEMMILMLVAATIQ